MSNLNPKNDEPVAVVDHSGELSNILRDYPDLLDQAARADQVEHELSFTSALRVHYKPALWSVFLSTALIMEGYDMGSVRDSLP